MTIGSWKKAAIKLVSGRQSSLLRVPTKTAAGSEIALQFLGKIQLMPEV